MSVRRKWIGIMNGTEKGIDVNFRSNWRNSTKRAGSQEVGAR